MGTASFIPASLYDCPVVENRAIGPYRQISFVSTEIAALASPGQFVMVRRAGPAVDPLLPRPMCVSDLESDVVKLLVEPVGKGSRKLAASQVGDRLRVLGPLGMGFDTDSGSPAVVVGGGIGVSPLVLLARALESMGRDVRCILGFRSRHQAVATELFSGLDIDVITEDGSIGRQGLVSDPLPGCLAPAPDGKLPEVFACGPDAMLRAVARISAECGVRAQVSVATHMACGVGACQGCVITTRENYQKVCTAGPVFEAGDLVW